MGKNILAMLLAAGLVISCCAAPACAEDDVVVSDSADTPAKDSSDSREEDALVSPDGLFELIDEKQSKEGQTLEDVLPEPQVVSVPDEPPSSSLSVKTLSPYPSPFDALREYADEYVEADFRFYSDSLFYTCTKHKAGNGSYYLTHVIIKDASQINGDDSFGDFGGERETPQDAAVRTGAEILINGSYFKYETGYATGGELLIRNNEVVHGPYSDGYEICLRRDGTLFSPGYNTIDSVLAQDVVFSWGTCEDLLIKDGQECVLTDFDWNGFSYPRTAVGMVRPLEYYIITAGGADHSEGITIYQEQKIFHKLGCQYARGLDGGGSSALVIGGSYINENGDRLEDGSLARRGTADFLLFYSQPD